MIIEITGVPGSGKTSVFRDLTLNKSEYLMGSSLLETSIKRRFSFIRNRGLLKILLWIVMIANYFISFRRNYKFHLHCLRIIFKYDRKIKAFISYFSKYSKFNLLRNYKGKKIILDEGIIHISFSLFSRSILIDKRLKDDLTKYFNLVPLPDVVYIKTPPTSETLKKRILNRGHHRLDNVRHAKVNRNKKRVKMDQLKLDLFIKNNFIIHYRLSDCLAKRVKMVKV